MTSITLKSGLIMNGDMPLFLHEWNTVSSPDLLFLGPLRATAYNWRPVAEHLQDRFHSVAVNLRGHCDSGPMLKPFTDVDGYISDAAATITQLELKTPVVIAFAPMISGAAVRFAAEHPDKLRGLVLIEGGPPLNPKSFPNMKASRSALPTSFATWADAVAFLRDELPERVKPLAEERAPYYFRRTTAGTVEWKYDPVLREEFMGENPPPYMGGQPDTVWEAIQCPIRFIVPKGGPRLEGMKQLVKFGKGSTIAEVSDTGHYIHEENPDGFFAALLPFLDEVFGTQAAARA